jgi:hypothetical protein
MVYQENILEYPPNTEFSFQSDDSRDFTVKECIEHLTPSNPEHSNFFALSSNHYTKIITISHKCRRAEFPERYSAIVALLMFI